MTLHINTRKDRKIWKIIYWILNNPRISKLKKMILSLYFRVFIGRISIKNEDFMDAWGSSTVTEKSYHARGLVVGYCAYGDFIPQGKYQGQDLHKWCYKGSWGYG